jgi:hypothetical protein
VGVGPQRDTKGSGETEIGELEVSILVDEQVLRLEISMEDSVGVAVIETFNQLERESLYDDRTSNRAGRDSRLAERLGDRSGREKERAERRRKAGRVGEVTYLYEGWTETFVVTDGVHVALKVHVEELKDEVEFSVRVNDV